MDINVFTNERLLYLCNEITIASAGIVNQNILCLNQKDDLKEQEEKKFIREPIKLYINSFGGNTYAMWALIDIIASSKTPIHTYCVGLAASAAAKIFIAGHRRYIGINSTIMLHGIYANTWGPLPTIQEEVRQLDKVWDKIEKFVVNNTLIPKKKLQEIVDKQSNWYLTAEEAVQYGVTDEIIK